MADFSKLSPDNGGTILNCKDATARTGVNNAFKVMGEMGAKNWLLNNATSQTINELPFVVNDDKTIYINGTPIARTVLNLFTKTDNYKVPAGQYILSKGASSDVGIVLEAYNGNTWVKTLGTSAATDEVTIDIDYDGYDRLSSYVVVNANYQVDQLTIKPMLRLADDSDTTYHKRVMTNKEITDYLTTEDIFANFFTNVPTGITVKGKGSTFISKVGKMVMGVVVLERADGFASGTSYTLTMDDAYKPRENFNATGQFLDNEWSDITESATGYMFLGNSGSFIIKQTSGQSLRYFKGMFAYTTL